MKAAVVQGGLKSRLWSFVL